MNSQHKTSQAFFEKAIRYTPGGVHSPVRAFKNVGGQPIFMSSAQGAMLKDVDGQSYIDYCMSWGPLILGHRDPEVHEALLSALDRGWSFGTAEPYSLELAQFICENIPWIDKIRFVNSGTEAVMSALRLARAYTGKNKILKFDGCYHGHVDQMLVKAGSGVIDLPTPDSAGVTAKTASETLVAPLGNIQAVQKIFDEHGSDIAAIIIEPLPANNGLLIQTPEFLKSLREISKKNNSLLIFDEVISGFRISFGGMSEHLKITPDLVTYGKIIGGGFPVGAYAGKKEIMDLIAPQGPVYQAGTLSGNPIAMTAGLATLKKLKKENPYNTLEKKTLSLSEAIQKIADQYEKPIQTRKYGSIFWVIIEDYKKLFLSLINQGVYLAPSRFEVGFMSTAHSQDMIEKTVQAFEKSISAL